MTTKSPLIPLLAFLMMAMLAPADMTSHSPAYAVEIASDIAVGVVHVSHENGLEVRFKPQTILKGNMQPGSSYIINYDASMRFRLSGVVEKIADHAEGKGAVIFVGWLLPDGRTISPDSFDGAIWPRATKASLDQTPDTLEECITFVKALLMNPKLKLKNVNGRRVLPDNYTLPTTPLAAPTLPDHVRVVTYLSPRKAVESARDIAVGTVQVSHSNGLEVLFTPQTVIKGGMQSGATYIVNYPPAHAYYRDHMKEFADAAEGKPAVMLLGRLQPDGKTFEPEGLDSAVWPRSSKWGGVFQTPDTLEGCTAFIKALLANPDLKLKTVNDRQMLPDGYTPPPSSAGTTQPGVTPPVTPKIP